MNPDQITLVQTTWQKVLPIQNAAASLFYGRLFELAPETRPLFRGDMTEQGRKLMAMISVAVSSLDRLDAILPAVQDMGRRHAGYGVQEAHYDQVGEALLWTLGQGLGEHFTPAAREAWATAYGVLAGAMQEAARQTQAA